MQWHNAQLPNGLRIIGEPNPDAQSVAFGFFVRAGSRDETLAEWGVSHFLEHMVFKGTETNSAADVNRKFDDIGAHYNASTSEELTQFYACVLPEYFESGMELLADIMRPSLRADDFDMEKQVILEEIAMYDDQPLYVAYDHAMQCFFDGHPLGRTILGSPDSITALSCEQMRAYHQARYGAGNIVLSVAGRFDWQDVLAIAERFCGRWPAGQPQRAVPDWRQTTSRLVIPRANLQQEQLVALSLGPPDGSPDRFAAELLSLIVGDDSNSRLYWELVDSGDAELAELSYQEFEGAGLFLTHLSCDPGRLHENLQVISRVYGDVAVDGVSNDELTAARTRLATRVVLRGERPMGRLGALGGDWLFRSEYRSVDQDLADIEGVTADDLRRVLKQYPLALATMVAVGPQPDVFTSEA